jgi:hypothetical protein
MKNARQTSETHATPDVAELRKFGLVFGSLIIGAFGLLIPWLWDLEIAFAKWPWPLGALFIVWALVHPASLGPVFKAWMKFGHAIGWFNTRVILGLVFYTVIMPMGLLMRTVFRKDPMHRRFVAGTQTYRINSEKSDSNTMERPY